MGAVETLICWENLDIQRVGAIILFPLIFGFISQQQPVQKLPAHRVTIHLLVELVVAHFTLSP